METISVKRLDAIKRAEPWMLVDFMSPSCGPCQRMLPVLQQLQAHLPVRVVQVNVNEDTRIVNSKYGVKSLPTVVLYQYGGEMTRKVGAFTIGEALRFFSPFFH